jgi:hypothetical protein
VHVGRNQLAEALIRNFMLVQDWKVVRSLSPSKITSNNVTVNRPLETKRLDEVKLFVLFQHLRLESRPCINTLVPRRVERHTHHHSYQAVIFAIQTQRPFLLSFLFNHASVSNPILWHNKKMHRSNVPIQELQSKGPSPELS